MNKMYARVLEAFADRAKVGPKGRVEADAAFALLAAKAGASPRTIADIVSCTCEDVVRLRFLGVEMLKDESFASRFGGLLPLVQ